MQRVDFQERGPHRSSACPHNATATSVPALVVGFVVTQSLVCTITSFWNTPGLGLHPQQRHHNKVRFQSCSDFQSQKGCFADASGPPGAVPTQSTNCAPYGSWVLLRLPSTGGNDTARWFSLRGSLGSNHFRRDAEPTAGSVDTPQISGNPWGRGLLHHSAQSKGPPLRWSCCLSPQGHGVCAEFTELPGEEGEEGAFTGHSLACCLTVAMISETHVPNSSTSYQPGIGPPTLPFPPTTPDRARLVGSACRQGGGLSMGELKVSPQGPHPTHLLEGTVTVNTKVLQPLSRILGSRWL